MRRKLGAVIRRGRGHAAASLWGVLEYFAYPFLMFLATPFFLRWLGQVQYGQWMLLMTIVGLGGLAGVGMGAAATKDVSAARGREDHAAALATVRACLSVTLVSSGALCLLIILAGMAAAPGLLANMGPPAVVRAIIVIGALVITLEQLDTVFAGTMRGMERFDLSARAEVAAKTLLVLGALAVAWWTHSLWAVLITTFSCTLLRLVGKGGIAAYLLGRIPWPSWQWHDMRAVFAFGKWTWAQSLGAALFSTADRFLVGGMLGATALAHYSICLQLAQQVQTVPSAGAQFLFPAISRRREAGESFRTLALRASLLIAALGVALALGLALVSHLVLSLWVGKAIADDSWIVLVLLATAFGVLAINVGPFYVLLGMGRSRFIAIINIVAGLVTLAAMWLAVSEAGLIGAAATRILYGLILTVSISWTFQLRASAGTDALPNPQE